jgi:pyruvate dehydrogenase E2 component (dihydrolipoamide acetyltransferase)
LNLENGDLVVPVIKDAPEKDLDQIVGEIRGFQKKALRRRLSPEDLSGATVAVTSLIGTGAHQVLPIIVPGQSAIVAIGDLFELGGLSLHSLTLAFDHRVLNGVEAAAFLAELSDRLQRSKLDE